MNTQRIFLFLGISTLAITTGCEMMPKPKVENAQFWQRINASETVYINGPKAQQLLNRDISKCVTELRELERLGQIKNSIPMDVRGNVLPPDEKQLRQIDSPERDGYLFAEHKNYESFDGCMLYNGWERTQSVNYETARRAEKNFFRNHIDFDEQGMSEHMKRGKEQNLNRPDYNE
ncbi:MAG: hypothetical protein AB8B83_00550 [Bdellovibrionales bacterium]